MRAVPGARLTPLTFAADRARSMRILMVEDDDAYVASVQAMLEEASPEPLEFAHVRSIADALSALETIDPSCVLLDLTLPGADGLEGLSILRAADPWLPIVILTAHEDETMGISAMAVGAQDYLTKPNVGGRELLRAVRYASERRLTGERLQQVLLHDALTGLPGRALLNDRLEFALRRRLRVGSCVALLLIDLDDFAYVNNALGHVAGDRLLVDIARRLLASIRPADTVGRIAGDEFMVVCEDFGHEPNALRMAERVGETLAQPYESGDQALRVTASIGVALARSDEVTAGQLMREAAAAVAHAKDRAGISIETFDEWMRDSAMQMVVVNADLHDAITHGELVLHYQPLVDLRTGRLHALEALVRWPQPGADTAMPESFIPAAERSGLIVPLGGWVLHEACREMSRWRDEGLAEGVRMSVNVSGAQLRAGDFVERLSSALATSGLDPEDLTLELIESAVLFGSSETNDALAGIKALGPRLAMDDFGTGFAALASLIEMHFDEVKIDRSFIVAMAQHDRPSIVGPVLRLVENLGIETVCEGIESRRQVELLVAAGATTGQGFLFGHSAPADEADVWLAPDYRFDVSVN